MPRGTVADQIARLRRERDALDKREKALLSKTRGKALAKVVQIAQDNGLSAADIAEALKSGKPARAPRAAKKTTVTRSKVAPKYRNPADATQTWTGRGHAPVWARELKEAGKLESTRIVEAIKTVV